MTWWIEFVCMCVSVVSAVVALYFAIQTIRITR
jgi:hypothetical protein